MKKIKLAVLLIILSGSFISAQSKFGIGIGGTFVSPTGDFADLYKSGLGGSVALTYDLTNSMQLSLSSGYSQLSFNNDKINEMLNAFGLNVNVDVDSKLKLIPVMAGVKYFFTESGFKPYASAELGLHIIEISASSVKIAGGTYDAVDEESKTAAAWGIGAGFLYKIAPAISIDVNAKINGNNLEVGTNNSYSETGYSYSETSKSTMTFFTVSAGILFEI
jgi:opacity protein-like surface antigen